MPFIIEALPAKEGDCLLLHWGEDGQTKTALIDGGPAGVYLEALSERLKELGGAIEPARLELLMISHCDADHIVGVRDLLRKVKAAVENHQVNKAPAIIERLWHNTFEDIIGDPDSSRYTAATAGIASLASVEGEPSPDLESALRSAAAQRNLTDSEEEEALVHDLSMVLASHGQSREVRDLHRFLRQKDQIRPINHPAVDSNGDPELISTALNKNLFNLKGLSIQIVGPSVEQLESLKKEFDAYIKKNGLVEAGILAAYLDKSAPNLSSIVCLAEFNGSRILLTGDARGDHILEGLKSEELLDSDGHIHVDVLKVPHHGSNRNTSLEFFQAVSADHYIISGNGKHGNPDRETLEWIIKSRTDLKTYHIWLTYTAEEIDAVHMEELQSKHKPWLIHKHSVVQWRDEVASLVTSCVVHDSEQISIAL
ncbi:MAG: hypothetical protein SF172_04215 [Burkholderiales bacterium]|nr:hypothetical protein [Burkholderiales bacterium]